MKKSFFDKAKKGLYTILTAGALAFGSFYGCDNSIEPEKPNQKPVAQFVLGPKQGYAPLIVAFNGTKSYDPDGEITKYVWDFGNRAMDSTSGIQVTHIYKNKGNYNASLIVEDNKGARSDKVLENVVVDTLIVPNQKPVAQFTANPKSGNVPLTVNFNGSLSYDSDGTITKWYWDFNGDDAVDDSVSGANVSHTYNNIGNYVASLRVKDNEGALSDKKLETIVANEFLGQIAFWSDKDHGAGELYIGDLVNDSLTNMKRLTNNFVNDIFPYFSPDGSEIVWSANRATSDGWFALYIMNRDGTVERRLTPIISNFSAYFPFWARNNKIYFNYVDRDSSQQGIAVINPDGTGFQTIINEGFHSWLSGRPSVSPDGTQLAFITDRDGNLEVYVSNIDGSNQRNLTNNSASEDQPMFSPDGKEILFISDRYNGSLDILVMNTDGSNIRRLTTNSGNEVDAIWSNNNKILFVYDVSLPDPKIYIMNADGTNWKQLTSFTSRCPAWRPR